MAFQKTTVYGSLEQWQPTIRRSRFLTLTWYVAAYNVARRRKLRGHGKCYSSSQMAIHGSPGWAFGKTGGVGITAKVMTIEDIALALGKDL